MGQREIKGSGHNSQGNYYESFKSQPSDANQNSYHYYNSNGSYYSSNTDGGKYYESPSGQGYYTPASDSSGSGDSKK